MLTDFRGTEIKVGSVITYAVKNSTSVTINEATVTEITTSVSYHGVKPALKVKPTGKATGWRRNYARKQEFVTLTNLENVVVVG